MKLSIYTLFMFFPFLLSAQAYEGSVEYNKRKHSAFIIEYPFGPEAVENAVLARMQNIGYKAKEEKGIFNNDKGFRKFKNAYISEIHDKSHDYIIKVERKSRKDSDRSLVYMIMMKDDVNAMNTLDSEGVSRAKDFLNNLLPDVEASQLDLDIKGQEEVLAKAEKKLRNLREEKKSMEDKIKKLEEDIRSNEKDQENTEKEISNQRQALENLKNKRRA